MKSPLVGNRKTPARQSVNPRVTLSLPISLACWINHQASRSRKIPFLFVIRNTSFLSRTISTRISSHGRRGVAASYSRHRCHPRNSSTSSSNTLASKPWNTNVCVCGCHLSTNAPRASNPHHMSFMFLARTTMKFKFHIPMKLRMSSVIAFTRNIVNVTMELSSFGGPKKEKLEPHLRPLREATTTTWSKYFLGHSQPSQPGSQPSQPTIHHRQRETSDVREHPEDIHRRQRGHGRRRNGSSTTTSYIT
ncbi:hypothetical protein Taro_046446 [Colocasia esculenta]|uniref:Uncharacterized protein n=1 Tax=Colocasia esculenta TaxID=4460 RepID=A0A843X455_COLES|nr:hypothetical protein [Colocasia esculenta]